MRKLACLAIVIIFAASAIPAFAACAVCGSDCGKSVLQCSADHIKADKRPETIKIKDKDKLIPILKKVTVFQNMSDGIKEGSAEAKKESLRTAK